MTKNNLILILLIDIIIMTGTAFLIFSRYSEYKNDERKKEFTEIPKEKTEIKKEIKMEISDKQKSTIKEEGEDKDKTNIQVQQKPVLKEEKKNKTGIQVQKRNISFKFVSANARAVSIIGDFNNWTPQELKKTGEKNTWEITVKLLPGEYRYNYIVNGKIVLDPYNKNVSEITEKGFKSSILKVKEK